MTHANDNLSANEAIARLRAGNERYIAASCAQGDISSELRKATFEQGQAPYAIVLACSDSRVIPEAIFSAGIGELFVIRVAGNVVDNHQLGSIEYAEDHLGTVKFITDEIADAIGDERDEAAACLANVAHSVRRIEESRQVRRDEQEHGLRVVGALYHTDSGLVEFLDA